MTMTVADIRDAARQRSDMVNSNFVKPAEWISYINFSWAELYDILVAKFEDYYSIQTILTVPSGTNSVALPADFYKMRGVDRALTNQSSEFYTIRPFTFEDRNNRRRSALFRGLYPTVRYRIFNNTLIFTPDDAADGVYRIWYIPKAVTINTDTQTIDGVNGWEEYIITDVAIKALQKEESDVSILMAQKQALLKRIEDMAGNRDAGETERVTDITVAGYDNPYFYRGGW